jgi:hypothetical protein
MNTLRFVGEGGKYKESKRGNTHRLTPVIIC